MCGINGFSFQDRELIKEMNKLTFHRGPDGSGIYSNKEITLGHNRLKIIDLSEKAAQPMSDTEKKIWIVFNGEIYNFKEIREQLGREGYKFKSDSDTEIIIHAYKKWGYDCVKHFNGMWAFALYDSNKNKIFLSRDRIGKKPLYFYKKDGNLIFSSEIKSLLIHNIKKKLNKKAVSSFLSYRQVLGEETMFEDILKLLPAHNLIFDLNERKVERIYEYWDVLDKDLKINEDDAKEELKKILLDAVSLRQFSDVSIGSINSGGLDSSVISAIMASLHKDPIRTFTVKFPEKGFDETYFANLLARYSKTIHKEITIDTGNFLDIMKEYSKKKDQPLGIPNEIALYLLFKEIKKTTTVVLSGDGADEIFAGYNRIFRSPDDYEKLKKIKNTNPKVYRKEYNSLFKKYNGRFFDSELEHFMFLYNYFPEKEKNFFLKEEYKNDFTKFFKKYFDKISGSYMKKISYFFLKVHIQEPLVRLDNSSMASAVEARSPFLDYRVINFVFNLPFELKNPWKTEEHKRKAEYMNCDEIAEEYDIPKYILKKISENYIPKEIIERKKQSFPLPIQRWFKEDFFEESKKLILSEDSKIKSIVKIDKLSEWIEKNLKYNNKDFGQRLWILVSLELWLREWF